MSDYGRGERVALNHSFGDDIATFADVYTHRRGGLATIKTVWIRAADPDTTPHRPDGLSEATWAWLCAADRLWPGVERKLGEQARELALQLVRLGCGELQTNLDRTVQWPPAKWIPHPELKAQRAEQRALQTGSRHQDQQHALTLAAAVEEQWPGLARALRGTRHRQWLIWTAEDLVAGCSYDGPRAFTQHHTGDTKSRDSLVKDLLDSGVEPQILATLGINRNPYIGLGGPAVIVSRGRRLDLTGWSGPIDLRVPASEDLTIEVSDDAATLVVIENRQAAETVSDTHPDVLVVWCHGQPPDPVLNLIAEAAHQVLQVLICPDADLGGVLIAERIVAVLPPTTGWRVLDVGAGEHPHGEEFGGEARTRLASRTSRNDSLGALAAACLERGYAVEQEASTRAAILAAINSTTRPGPGQAA